MAPAAAWTLTKIEPGLLHLVRAAQYRITLRLGDFDALCAPKASDLGRQQRLQMLASFYEPLNSRRLASQYRHAFLHYREQTRPTATEAAAADALVQDLRKELVVLSGAPAGAESKLPGPGEFARIRLPGGFAISSTEPLGFPVPHSHRYDAEARLFSANPLLGAIPIVAKVETRLSDADAWSPAPADIQVHFQLQIPDAIPAGDPAKGGAPRTETRVNGGGGPKAYLDAQFAAHPAIANDPQVDNCVVDRGGKRRPGACRSTDYFQTTDLKGFNSDTAAPYPLATNSSHPNAMVAKTNAAGEAGVIFRPSRQGGDRFKLRVFLDPIGPSGTSSDGTEATAVVAETGTMVVWRVLKIGHYVRFDYPVGATPAARASAGGNLDEINFNHLKQDFARAYVELVVERTGAIRRCRIGDATWVAATNHARALTPPQPSGVGQRYDINALFPNVNASHGLIAMQLPGTYNAARGAAFNPAPAAPAADWNALLDHFMNNFIHYFSRNASGGVVIVQAPFGDTITANSRLAGGPGVVDLTTSGVAKTVRGCYLFYGSGFYGGGMPYDLQDNTLHELGHVLFLPHQWTERIAATGAVEGGIPPEHDYKDYCIMSYQKNVRNKYDYCGRCNLKLRGWNTRNIPKNNT
jgi:hypothetical protein